MTELQELISRGRFIFSGAEKRKKVFELINGKRTSKEISEKTRRSLSSVIQDIEKLRDFELVSIKIDKGNKAVKKNGALVYEKSPLVKHVSMSYFHPTSKIKKVTITRKNSKPKKVSIKIPNENEIIDIAEEGEDQLYEFKHPGVETEKITREIAAFVHTRGGGIIFYGIDDDGKIIGSDMTRQKFDQKIHNSIKNTISPIPPISITKKIVLGSEVLLVVVPPWDKKSIYQYTKNEKYYIRRGTNVFTLKSDEIKKLSRGNYVV